MSKSTDKNQLIICVVFERLLCVFIIWQKAAHTTFVNEAEKITFWPDFVLRLVDDDLSSTRKAFLPFFSLLLMGLYY